MKTKASSASISTRTGRRGFLGLLGGLLAAPGARGAMDGAANGSARHSSPKASTQHISLEDDRDEWLRLWADKPRIPITEPQSLVALTMLILARQGGSLTLYYHGGTMPGQARAFSPELVFRHEGSSVEYVSGYCHRAKAPRILRLDRIDLYGDELGKPLALG